MSDYKIISALNEEHKVYLVQSALSGNIYVQKILDVYNIRVYEYLYRNPVAGIPCLINYYEDGNQLIVIEEYISGTSLQEKIDNSDLSVSDIRSYMIMLCNILEALHSMTPPIIHRDIKPSNIIITSYNYAMLLDFNAAKQFSGQNESDTVLIGTPGYAAPEQYGFGSSSPKTDIYSLGIVLREMLGSITPAFDIAPILHRLNRIADKCTQMTPAARYQSVAELKMPYRSHIILRSTILLLPVIQVNMHTRTMIMQTMQPMPILLNELSTTVLPVSSHPDFARKLHGKCCYPQSHICS